VGTAPIPHSSKLIVEGNGSLKYWLKSVSFLVGDGRTNRVSKSKYYSGDRSVPVFSRNVFIKRGVKAPQLISKGVLSGKPVLFRAVNTLSREFIEFIFYYFTRLLPYPISTVDTINTNIPK
jgi:hypothetical protein